MSSDISTLPKGFMMRKLGNILDDLADAVKKRVTDPEIYQFLFSQIDRVKNIFGELLGQLIKDLDWVLQERLKDIHSEISKLEAMSESAKDVALRVQSTVNTLPLANTYPQVLKVTPAFIDKDHLGKDIILEIQGNFPDLQDKKVALTLDNIVTGGKYLELTPREKTTVKLKFLIPKDQVINGSPTDSVYHRFGILTIEKPGKVFGVVPYDFRILFTVIPPSPGMIKITTIATKATRESNLKSSSHCQNSSKHCAHKDLDRIYSITPTVGWKFDPDTSRINLLCFRGQFTVDKIVNRQDEVAFRIKTFCIGRHKSGRINFNIQATEYRDTEIENKQEESVIIKWGSSIVQDIPKNSRFVVTLKSFDGNENQYNDVGEDPFLKISKNDAGQLRIAVKPKERLL